MKADHSNDFFINVIESLTTKLNPLDKSTLSTFVTRITPTNDCTDFNWELVMKTLNPKKATGPDLVSPRDLFLVSSETSLPRAYFHFTITAWLVPPSHVIGNYLVSLLCFKKGKTMWREQLQTDFLHFVFPKIYFYIFNVIVFN